MANGYGSSSNSSANSSVSRTSSRIRTTSRSNTVVQRTTQQPLPSAAQTSPSISQQLNLVVKSNTANKTFDISQKVFKLPFDQKSVEIFIVPKKAYKINAKDFNHGVLPKNVSKITFNNLGTKVVATVILKNKIDSNKNIILDLPIFGKSIRKIDSFNINETLYIDTNVIVSGHSLSNKSIKDNKTQYLVKNALGKKSLILSKTFAVMNGFKFSKIPEYKIIGNEVNYKVVTSTKKDKNNVVISKTFNFYYTSLNAISESIDSEIIFYATTKDYAKGTNKKNSIANNVNTIYSIDKGRFIGPEGGVQQIVVRGTPGSAYSFIISNSSGLMYNEQTGSFSDTGGVIQGFIPSLEQGKSYGQSIVRVKIPRSTSGETISTQFISKESEEVQKAKLLEAKSVAEINKIQGIGETVKSTTVSLTSSTLTFHVSTDTSTLASTSVVAAEAEGVSTQAVTLTVDDGSGGASAATDILFLNKKVYKSDGTLFGTCTSVTSNTTLVFGGGITSAIANNDVLYTYATVYVGPKVKITDLAGSTATSQNIFLGKEGSIPLVVSKTGTHKFNFAVSALTADKLVQITRQPLFVMPTSLTDNYVAWDSDEAKKALAQQADGTDIPSDWDWSSVEKGANVSIKAKANGNGKILKTTSVGGVDKYAYSEVIIKGEIRVNNIGKNIANLSFSLNNFLSIV